MEVVPAADVPLALPFARSNVQEWSHLDQLTGVLQQGRVQAQHWASATRAYGKVVDSRRVASASGGVEQRRHQQVEVFQERGPGGSRLHVVRASRLSTSSSSSTTTSGTAAAWRRAPAFDNLQLPLNPLDSSPQKTRASVGRSGSIGGRRPPSRPRSLVGKPETTAAEAISEEHRDHGDDLEIEVAAPRIEASTATSSEDEDGGGAGRHGRSPASARRHSHSGIARKKSSSTEDLHCATPDGDGPAEVGTSSGGSGDDWRRDASVRRSLQFPGKAALGSPRLERQELPAFKSGSALRGLEALESVFRRGATIADSVNRTLADGGAGGDDALDVDSLAGHLRQEQQQMASSEEEGLGSKAAGKAAGKRHSFVTVEKLKEVRGRLRRLGSPPSDEASADSARSAAIAEERDDGIVTEEPDKREDCGPSPRARSFAYGADAAASGARKTVPGTGSLESRTSNRSSSSSGSRSEEWYNRRKSYGFEQVHEQGREAQLYGSPFRDKSKVESSTDSGICRSSETVTPWGRLVGSRTKTEDSHAKAGASSHIPVIPLRASHSIAINKANISLESSDAQRNSVLSERQDDDGAHQRGRTTVVTLGSKCEQRNVDFNNRNSGDSSLHNVSTYDNSDDEKPNHRRFSEPVTITIPITRDDSAVQNDALSNVEQKKQFYRKLSERPLSSSESNKPFVVNIKKKEPNDLSSLIDKRNSFSSDSTQPLLDSTPWRKTESWKSTKQEEGEMKRHSIAVDPRYVKGGTNHIMSFSHMSQNDNSEQAFTRISASELAKKFDSLSVSRKEQSQSTLQNGVRQFSTGINVSFVQNGFVRNEEEDEELSSNQMNIKKQKKVEFCKTEVHFVADSGRVNIVETDEKPPPTNMFRRRKRNNTATTNLQASDPNKSNLPQVRFGDSPYEKKLLGGNDSSVSEVSHTIHVDIANDAKVATTSPAKEISQSHIPANFQHDADKEDHIFTQANATISAIVKTEGNESPRFDSENSDAFQMQASTDKDNMPRSILKNYRKPRPFLLGENDDFKPKAEAEEGKQEEKWGVRLRPVQSSEQGSTTAMWRSQVSVSTTAFDVPQPQRQVASISSVDHNFRESENELQRQLRLLRPAHKKADVESFSPSTQVESRSRSSPPLARSFGRETEDKGIQVTVGPAATDGAQLSSWTVAERIRQVEEMRKVSGEVKGFSTRINFGAGEATVIEAGSSDEQQTAGQKSVGSTFEKTSASKAPWSPRQDAEGYLRTAHEEEVRQLPTARPPLPTHDSGRLRSVETFVSTRSGHPKITSISLHYEGDATPADTSKFQNVHTPPKDPDSATPLSAYSPSDTRAEKHHQAKVSMRAEKAGLCEDQSLYKQTAPPHQKDAAHKIYDVASKVRAPISYTERCYGDGESGSMSRRSRKTQENDRTYVVERKRFELQKEKYAAERDGLVTGKDSANEDSKCPTPRGSNTFVKEKVEYNSGKMDARRQIVEAEMCEEVKFTGTRERRSVSPEKAFSKGAATAAQKSDTLKSTSTVSVEEDEYCEQDVSDDSESAEETYGSIADKKISKRVSPIYDNVCETGDRPEARKKAAPENGRQISGKSSAVVKGQSASSSRKVTEVEKRSSRKASGSASGKRRSESPVYENREIICMEKDRKMQQRTRQEQRQHETAMLEELTRAADQILQAVNGYSDDDSNRPSSAEDEDRGRRHRRGQPRAGGGGALCTISEAPQRKGQRQPAGAAGAGARAAARRPAKPQLGPTSSTSSVDSVSERRAAAAAARRERAARLVQRASSREQLLQARASSSEDALSSLEAEERRPRPPPPRRQRPAGTSASTAAAARAQPAAEGHKRLSSGEAAVVSRTADRSTAKKSLTSHRLRESTKERITRTVSAKRDLAEVKHNTSRATTDKLPGSSHGLLPSSSKNKNERCISERRTVVAVMPLRPSPSSNVKKIKTTSSRTEGTQVKPVK
ncbi:uncharacterized protein LOC126345346 isoform X2 [Schistocerca gregaria]|uniref:uncharacterized protein LOC126345346 isoform X2 n=1 Tax=Schistocerca gregaria TaxID=7010 RepID=UPI00211E0952|nr:uncharacterized protein LOC126345346 isoform X2 [Schistocerca gregaria]